MHDRYVQERGGRRSGRQEAGGGSVGRGCRSDLPAGLARPEAKAAAGPTLFPVLHLGLASLSKENHLSYRHQTIAARVQMDDLNDLVWTQPSGSGGQAGANGLSAAGRTSSPFASSFDMLAGSSTASSINRSYNSSPMPRSLTPAQALPKPTRSPVNGGGGAGGSDAFAGLLSLGGSSSSQAAPTGLSLAQRQAKLAADQLEQKQAEVKAFQASGSFWDAFESGQGSMLKPAAAPTPLSLAPAVRTSSPLLTPSPRPTTPAAAPLKPVSRPPSAAPPASASRASLDPWDEFDVLASRAAPVASSSRSPAAAALAATRPSADPFDLFDQAALKPPKISPTPRTLSPRDHDFGDRPGFGDDARGLIAGGDGSDDDDDDFMGAFNRPKPQQVRLLSALTTSSSFPSDVLPPAQQASRPAAPSKASSRIARPASPPIHLIGQLVEMGFSPSAAREALASTESGQDVETAAAMLLSAAGGPRVGASAANGENDDDAQERERQRKEEEEAERRRQRRQGPSRSAVAPDRAPSPASRPETPSGDLVAPLQDLLATTNLIGQSVFNRANAFWSSSKQQVQKAYEERQRANGSPAPGTPRDGRPKWMVDAEAAEAAEWQQPPVRQEISGSFKDGDEEEEAERPRAQVNAQASSSRRPPAVQQPAVPSLIEPEAPRSYTSSRRHPPKPTASPAPDPAPRAPARQPSPAAPLKQRKLVPAPAHILDAATGYRAKGNAAFKLGQFGEAEAAYSTAIDILPDNHLQLVPLLNNRAAARLKNGDHSASVADSSRVISLIGLDYDPAKEAPLPTELADVVLGEALVKAVSKRAAALEMGERWAQAQADWELVGSLAVCRGAAKTAALDGARRCKKMVDVLEGRSTPAAPLVRRPAAAPTRPAARPRPKTSAPVEGGASSRLKKANAALESEEAERSELKDSVDGRVAAWKTGKEANVRALIASLDGVLWPELGWQKVGLHELVTDKQVKIRYTKAIGKLHPDKLAVGQTTVEQRMIAGAVFGTLNEGPFPACSLTLGSSLD